MKIQDYRKAKAIIISDYSEYDGSRCNNGGCYGFDTIYTKVPNKDIWYAKEETTGEFCPYCYSWYCGGGCERAKRAESMPYGIKDILEELHYAVDNGLDITFEI